MPHCHGPNFQVITTDALVDSDVWRKMVKVSVNRSFNQITVSENVLTGIIIMKFCGVELNLDNHPSQAT